ncbi:type II secretion system inner membrane protein GspF [Geoalkalibacter halelectricus]|uniref:General secretion pathway protein F n=1 Tax=Geoalkalibacter halelectricus TaxID=2847045 RepID=A0ABY5ZKL3_9BACT|nr:type II secretion system inner membrane protein GspF [Geoalkalibacter halelectricus]MDO3379668.1 type II secretion system inner membrane protein GspF [Geoalkalibacter halelectricus]UWZ78517.1 type II secretion system inner membrane protein GspF [Geoalkalibacter halelectricus]
MPLFDYAGYNAQGKKVSGVVEGSGRRAALQQLKSKGIIATTIEQQSAAVKSKRSLTSLIARRRIPVADLAAATRQLATLLSAGIPLDEALGTLAEQQEKPAFAKALNQTREEVVQGQALNQGLARHPHIFSDLYVNMVKVGESSGTLDQVLHRLADFLEEQARLRSRIQAAMAYPVLMALIGIGVLFFLMAFVVPKVTRMLEDMDRALPLPTQLLIGTSDFLSEWWWLLLLLLLGALAGLRQYLKTEKGQYQFDRRKLSLPLIGKLNLLLATARLTRTLGTLLRSGVPLLAALEIVQNLMDNRVLKKALEDTIIGVREGESLAQPLLRSGVFPKMVSQMAAVGEKSGELEEMLFKVADAYEHQVDSTINALLSLLEPIMILLMGTVVGFIVLAILLPIFEASQGIG